MTSASPWSAINAATTSAWCAGAATSYVLRRIAYRAGTFAPGIDDAIFRELHSIRHGHGIDNVERWLATRASELDALGYRLRGQRTVIPTTELAAWVDAGCGYRGAVVPTSAHGFHIGNATRHAVGLAIESRGDGESELAMIDPWPPVGGALEPSDPAFDRARRECSYDALALHWGGWD